MSDYSTVVAGAAGALGLKMAVTHLLTVRSRLITAEFKTSEDSQIPSIIGTVFKFLTLAFGPALPINRLTGVVHNSVENEPYFLAMAILLGSSGQATSLDVLMVKAYVVLRLLHAIAYMAAVQPYRALSFVGGLGINLCFGARLSLLLL